MQYQVTLKKSDEAYAIWCPSLPGCCFQGDTKEEALDNIKDVIESYLIVLQQLKQDEESYYVEIDSAYAKTSRN